MAGCFGSDDGSGNGGNGNGESENDGNGNGEISDGENDDSPDDVDIWFRTGGWRDPTDIQWNPFNSSTPSGILTDAVWEEYANYNYATNEWVPHAAEDWEIDGDQVTLEIRNDLVWSDGEDVTAEDVVVGMELSRYQDAELWEFAESVETDGDTTVVISLEEPANEEIIEWVLLGDYINVPAHVYGEYLDRLEDGEDEDDVVSELASREDRDPVTCGPFYISDDKSTTWRIVAPAFDDHPDADVINFNGYHQYQRSEGERFPESVMEGSYDGMLSLFVPTDVLAEYPEFIDEIRIPGTFGVGLTFNFDVAPLDDRNVRQAIAFATDMELAAANADPEVKSVPAVPAGITSANVEEYLGDALDSYEAYEHDQDRAAERLREAGTSKKTVNGST